MKLIIAGGRDIFLHPGMIPHLFAQFNLDCDEVVCGMAKGVDTNGQIFAEEYQRTLSEFPADWETHGKAAGPIRNRQMAEYADALLLIWDGKSSGSKNMKSEMMKLNKPIYEVVLTTYNDGETNS